MARRPKFKPTLEKGRPKPWRTEIPASVSATGKRERYFFKTKTEAETWAETQETKLRNFGAKGATLLTPSTEEQAANALELLSPYNVTLNEVVQDWISRRKATDASITFETAMDEFALPTKDRRRSDSYARSLRQTKTRLSSLHGKMLNQITPADIEKAIDKMPASVKNFTLRILAGLFHFGRKRDYCAEIPTLKVDGALHEKEEIQIYSPQQAAKILHAAEKHDRKLVPFLAISFFAGIRLSEMNRLEWTAIDLPEKFIRLPGGITKTRLTRFIDISPTLEAWLQPYVKKTGKVVPYTPDVLRNAMAELKVRHKVPTIKHGPRHCFASYWMAEHGDIDQLCRYLGHDDPETTFKHYAKAATKREALKYHAILPKRKPSAKVIKCQEEAA